MRAIVTILTGIFLATQLSGCNNNDPDPGLVYVWQNNVVEILRFEDNGQPFFFMRQKNDNTVMEALTKGKLSISNGCTILQELDGETTLVWPEDFIIEKRDNRFTISDGDIILEAGDSLEVSGGFYSEIPDIYCSGKFWLIGAEIRVLD